MNQQSETQTPKRRGRPRKVQNETQGSAPASSTVSPGMVISNPDLSNALTETAKSLGMSPERYIHKLLVNDKKPTRSAVEIYLYPDELELLRDFGSTFTPNPAEAPVMALWLVLFTLSRYRKTRKEIESFVQWINAEGLNKENAHWRIMRDMIAKEREILDMSRATFKNMGS